MSGLDDLQSRLNSLRARRESLDFPAARERLRRAEANRDRLSGEPRSNEERIERDKSREEFKAARNALQGKENEDRSLIAEIQRLEAMLNGEKRVEVALVELATADAGVADAEKHLQASEQALARVEEMIEQEKRDVDASRAHAAQQLLDALNQGDSAARVPAQSAGANLETLEIAKAAAQRQVEDARDALRAAGDKRVAAIRTINAARFDIAVRALHIARSAYVQALATCMASHWRAHRQSFGEADPRGEAIAISQQLLAAEGY